jgi:uroporphyrinogen decarboxylase
MNSRERVRAVLKHSIPDYVPNGLGGCETVGLHVIAYDNLQNVLRTEKKPPRMDTFMCNAVFEQDVLKAMGGDIILVESPRMCSSPLWRQGYEIYWKEQSLWGKTFTIPVDEYFRRELNGTLIWENRGTVCPEGTYFFDSPAQTDFFADIVYPSPDSFNPPHNYSDDFLKNLERTAKDLYEQTEFSLCLGETITDLQYIPGGYAGMVLMLEEPEVIKEFLEKMTDAALAQLKLVDQAVGKYVDILSIAHDFGDNNGVMIGDELWRKIYKPHYKKLFGNWHKITDMKINLHSCGSIYGILGDLIECGVDIINPVQISARGMSPGVLKKTYGNDIIFWGGGYDAQLISNDFTYEQVYDAVSKNIKIFKQDGRFIFGGVHNLPATIPEPHLSAMIDAWRDNRSFN